MRHVYFRSILTVIWLTAAIFSAATLNIPMAALYLILAGACLSSAYQMWKKEKNHRGGN